MKTNKYEIRENRHIVDQDYKVRDNVMITRHTAHKYETPYMGPFFITQCFTNDTISLKIGATQTRYNICRINPYTSDTKVEYFGSKNMLDNVNI